MRLLIALFLCFRLISASENVSNGECPIIPFINIAYFQCPLFTDLHCIRSMIKSKSGLHTINCALMEPSNNPEMKIVNATELINALQHTDPFGCSFCSIVVFYSPSCVFSRRVAGYVYLLAKLFPQLQVYAVNLNQKSPILDHLINQHGIAATPVIFLFENNIAKLRLYDESKSLEALAETILRRTDLKLPKGVNSDDLFTYGVANDDLREQYDVFITQFFNFDEVVNGIDRYFVFACIVLSINLLYFLYFSSRIQRFWPANR